MRKNLKMILAVMMVALMLISVTACTSSAIGGAETEPQMAAVETTLGGEEDVEGTAEATAASDEAIEDTTAETEAPTEEPTEAETEPEKETEAATEPAVEETRPQSGGNSEREDKEQDPTEPPATIPSTTEPVETESEMTEPAETEPTEPEPVVTEPPATEPPATEPPATEPSAPTECEHDWEIIYHPQEGYYTDPYVICACGAKFATESEWWTHAQSYKGTGELINHSSWGGARDFIEISPCYYEWICRKCGYTEVYYV